MTDSNSQSDHLGGPRDSSTERAAYTAAVAHLGSFKSVCGPTFNYYYNPDIDSPPWIRLACSQTLPAYYLSELASTIFDIQSEIYEWKSREPECNDKEEGTRKMWR